MNKKQVLRVSVDIVMTILLILLMAYSLVGEAAHEWLGVAMFVLFVLHHLLNRPWHNRIFKGNDTPYRTVQTALVILAFLTMCGSMISGVILSRTVFSFLGIRGGQAAARTIHMAGRRHKKKSAVRSRTVRIIGWLVAVYGVYAFWKRSILGYMLLQIHFVFFDPSESLILYFLDYLAIISLFVCAGHYLACALRKKGNK